MFRTGSNMRQVLGPVLPVTTPAITKPAIQSPAMLLARLKAGGVTEWDKMTYLEKMNLVNEYGYGSEVEFMKKFKQVTGRDLDLRSYAKPEERLGSGQLRKAAGLVGGSARYGPPIDSVRYRGQVSRTRKARRKARGSRKRKVTRRT